MVNIREYWKKLKFWQKGAIIGGAIFFILDIIPPIASILLWVLPFFMFPALLLIGLLVRLLPAHPLLVILVIGTFYWALIGAIVGKIIQKIQKR